MLITAERHQEGSKDSKEKIRFFIQTNHWRKDLRIRHNMVDIGSAITTLAQYNTTPEEKHFQAAQQVMAYLVENKD